MANIVHDDDIRSGDPRIEGTRITISDIKRRVIDNNEDPYIVAGEYDLSMADLFHSLAYYYEHRDDFEAREHETAATRKEREQQTHEIVTRAERDETDRSDFR